MYKYMYGFGYNLDLLFMYPHSSLSPTCHQLNGYTFIFSPPLLPFPSPPTSSLTMCQLNGQHLHHNNPSLPPHFTLHTFTLHSTP